MADNAVINQPNPQPYLLFLQKTYKGNQYYLIGNDKNKIPLEAPQLFRKLTNIRMLGNSNGCQSFLGDVVGSETQRFVKWNLTNNDCVAFDVIPTKGYKRCVVGFGVCRGVQKVVKISVKKPSDDENPNTPWKYDVHVCTLSTGEVEWRKVDINNLLLQRDNLECAKVCVKGFIYFRAFFDTKLAGVRQRHHSFYSFNLESEMFGRVSLPESLRRTPDFIQTVYVYGSLGLLHYNFKDFRFVCDVWTKEEGANTFTKVRTVNIEGQSLYGDVLWVTNNDEAVVELYDSNKKESRIVFYELSSGRITDVGIRGNQYSFVVRSYNIGNAN